MSLDIKPQFASYIQNAYYVWLTTVRDDGMPQPTPVWFIWENGTFLIYSMPTAYKIRNIRANPLVALSYAASQDAEEYVVIMGEAKIERNAPPPSQHPAYIEKYRQGIADINMTPESFDQTFSAAIRVVPTRVRGE
ncbi:MAG TPA: TIGR03667 family PPOX class F420-dependent oxidoreductase [Oceanobacillus sp.]|nr:TIGR03667 family PPOX class F420-dependent oxidoreductase [Oceanobacillus sp.]